ncbi:MAG: NAD(P)/FAD-dependent oxidoreductase [Hyphomicrobiales bacterium]|nr:NAD(P)/FAD-dependent oxidoreductase [Hyphomicrobiales bacterium]MCP5371318.1 NAD(P)/FAD-dependent oxidoreductase [Hyphomicrobiales bacterium]
MYDVAILGGGIVGCAIARELTRYRLRLVLLEKECEVGFGTSKSNSGIIHAGHHSGPDTLKGPLEWAGNRKWDVLHEELDFGFERIGELMVAWDAEQVEILEKYKKRGEDRGVPGLEIWDRDRVRREEPSLSRDIIAALHAPTAGVVNPYEVCFSLIDSARHNGLEIRVETTVTGVAAVEGGLRVDTDRGAVAARYVVNAAGLFADRIAAAAGAGDFRIRPRKGEEYLLDKRLRGLVRRIIFPCPTATSKGVLVIPTFDGTIMVGPTANPIDDKGDLSTSSEGSDEVFDQVRRTVPGISPRDCIAEFAGLRAVADGEDFIIGPSAVKGFINVAGIQSPGLTAAPAIADMVRDILADEGLALSANDDFVPEVPKRVIVSHLDTAAQVALAARDSRYGHICCRCELVTEGEVVDAIHAGAGTLDGIKFRTRAGMGRCQGGFCTWRCMELLSREMGIPIEQVTKRGGGSWLVCRREDLEEGSAA